MIDNWIEVELKDVADYINGRAFKPTEWEDKGLPIIRIQNLNDPQAKFNYTTKEFEEKYLIKNKDLLFAWSASLGAFIWNGGNAWLNQHIFKVNCKPIIEKYFLYYFLDKITKELYSKTHGSGMVHVTKSKFVSTLISLPPLPEQRAIVARIEELFSRLDKGVETLQKVKEQLKVYRQAVLKWAFEGKLTAEWRKSKAAKSCGSPTTAEELLQQIKAERERHYQQKLAEWQKAVDEWEAKGKQGRKPAKPKRPKELPALTEEELAELPELPEGWGWIQLGEILEVSSGKSLTISKLKNGKYPVYGGNGINGFHTDYLFEDEKLIIGRVGVKCGVTHIARPKSWVTDNALVVYPLINSFLLKFFKLLLEYKNLNSLSGSTAQPVISGSKIYKVIVPICSISEQQAIVQEIETRLSVADKLEQIIDETLQKAEALRQSILKKAFEGRLLSEAEREALKSDPEWEPAEKLLERIKAEKEKQETKKNNTKKRK